MSSLHLDQCVPLSVGFIGGALRFQKPPLREATLLTSRDLMTGEFFFSFFNFSLDSIQVILHFFTKDPVGFLWLADHMSNSENSPR